MKRLVLAFKDDASHTLLSVEWDDERSILGLLSNLERPFIRVRTVGDDHWAYYPTDMLLVVHEEPDEGEEA